MERDLTQQPGINDRARATAGWVLLVAQVLETSVVVITRRDFGRRFFGLQAALVIPLVLVYALAWEGHDTSPLLAFLGLYLFACALARARIMRRGLAGDTQHSHYSGTPSILRAPLFRSWLSERAAKQRVEPLLVFAIGLGLMQLSEPLGSYLMLAAFGMAVSMQVSVAYEQTRFMDLRDAQFEQRSLSERLRESRFR